MTIHSPQPSSPITQASDIGEQSTQRSEGISSAEFRNAMAELAASVCVVSAGTKEQRLGRTVTAAFSLSIDPPTILVSIDKGSALATLMQQKREFSYSLLSEAQQEIANAFAGMVPPDKRFDLGEWSQWPTGTPCLFDTVAAFDCEVTAEVDLAGHILFAGRIRNMMLDTKLKPLIWHKRDYASVSPPV